MVSSQADPDPASIDASEHLAIALANCAEDLELLKAKIAEVLSCDQADTSAQIPVILARQEKLAQYCQREILGRLSPVGFRLGVELNKQINLLLMDGQQLKIARQWDTQKLRLAQMQTRGQLIGEYLRQLQGME